MIPFDRMTYRQTQFFKFGDKRLDKRAERVFQILLGSDLSAGFPRIFNNQYELKSFYRLMNNKKVTPQKINAGYNQGLQHILAEAAVSQEVSPKVYYQYQDTTYGSYLGRNKLDLGYLENINDNGVVLHTALLTDTAYTPLGISWQKQILRDRENYQKAQNRKKRPFEEKESFKWVESMQWAIQTQRTLNARIIHVADREGDMLELFNYALTNDLDFIVRLRHDRLMEGQTVKIKAYLSQQPPKAIISRQLLDDKGQAYVAKCALFWTTIKLPKVTKSIQVIYLRQLDNLKLNQQTQWAIYTSLPMVIEEQAIQVLDVYTHRWRTCEDFHKCLKSGCSMEKRQFDSAQAMTNCITILSLTALHLLRMRHLAVFEDAPIEKVLEPQQIKLATILADKYLKTVDLLECQPHTVRWFVLILARMGGHQGIRQSGLPGWKTLWLGWSDFKKLMDGIILSMNFFNPT